MPLFQRLNFTPDGGQIKRLHPLPVKPAEDEAIQISYRQIAS